MDWSEGKPLAKALFGRPARVLLAAWILERDGSAFFLLEAQKALINLDEAGSAVAGELDVFVRAGMLTRIDDPHRVYFQPTPHELWDVFAAIGRYFDLTELLGAVPSWSGKVP